jgi:hypothetical protein
MTQAFNLSQLANYVNTSGQLNGATGISGTVSTATTATTAQQVATANFTIYESGGVLYFKYGSTNILSLTSTGSLTAL